MGMEEAFLESGGEGGQKSFFPLPFFQQMLTICVLIVKANDQSGYIGAAIVGGFLLLVVGWYGGQWAAKKLKAKQSNSYSGN